MSRIAGPGFGGCAFVGDDRVENDGHPDADGAAIGAATMADFHRLAAVVAELSRGVVINLTAKTVLRHIW